MGTSLCQNAYVGHPCGVIGRAESSVCTEFAFAFGAFGAFGAYVALKEIFVTPQVEQVEEVAICWQHSCGIRHVVLTDSVYSARGIYLHMSILW